MKRIFLSFLVLSALAMGSCLHIRAEENPEKIYPFIETVVLGVEYGQSRPVAARWMRSPSLSIFDAQAEQTQAVENIVQDLNLLLQEGRIQIKIGKPENAKADIRVYFAARDEFSAIAERLGFHYFPGNAGYFYVWWSPGREIYRAVVLIDRKLKEKNLIHFVREEITQAMGLPNDSPLFKDSIFYQKGGNNGKAQQYSELDKKLIRFYYRHIRPGYGPDKLRTTFEKHWHEFS